MRFIFASILIVLVMGSQNAQASSCGFAPTHNIVLLDGAKATRDQLSDNVQQVQNFAKVMTQYLDCIEAQRESLFHNMNKDQQNRWNEDYDGYVEALANLQTSLNEQIRAFNSKNQTD